MIETLFDITPYTVIVPIPGATISKPVISSEIPLPYFHEIQNIASLNYIEVWCGSGYKNALCENLKLLKRFDKCIVNFDKNYFIAYIERFIYQLNKAYPRCNKITIDVNLKINDTTFTKTGTEIYFKPIEKSICK